MFKYTQSASLSCWVAEKKSKKKKKKSASLLRTVLDKIHLAQQHVCPHRFDDRILITDKRVGLCSCGTVLPEQLVSCIPAGNSPVSF